MGAGCARGQAEDEDVSFAVQPEDAEEESPFDTRSWESASLESMTLPLNTANVRLRQRDNLSRSWLAETFSSSTRASETEPMEPWSPRRHQGARTLGMRQLLRQYSIGSEMHGRGCSPCGWYHRPGGCENGLSCCFCHICPRERTRSTMLNRRRARRRMAQRASTAQSTSRSSRAQSREGRHIISL
mmetsp:Transcript_109879/g.291783  ORF Transcript_109879/g.291783 Transcript_109879/m.291783 type:complete len:186 (-) Transcript_109879:41-598(-)